MSLINYELGLECSGSFWAQSVKILVILNPTGYMLAWNLYTFLGRFHSMSERCSYAMISLSLLCIIDGFKIVVPFGLPTNVLPL